MKQPKISWGGCVKQQEFLYFTSLGLIIAYQSKLWKNKFAYVSNDCALSKMGEMKNTQGSTVWASSWACKRSMNPEALMT